MITIIIGICLMSLCFYMIKKRKGKWWIAFWSLVLGMAVMFVGFVAPLSGYNEYIVQKEIKLSSIALNKDNSDIYVIQLKNGDNIYKDIEDETLKTYDKSLKLEIIEEETCVNPRLVHYFRPIKVSWFTLGLATFDDKYVFYIPKGSIIK